MFLIMLLLFIESRPRAPESFRFPSTHHLAQQPFHRAGRASTRHSHTLHHYLTVVRAIPISILIAAIFVRSAARSRVATAIRATARAATTIRAASRI